MYSNGYLKEISEYKGQDMLLRSSVFLSSFFVRNAEQLKLIGVSANEQMRDIYSMYGLKVSANTISELRTGKKYKCGFLLLFAIKDYWHKKGIYFSIEV